MAVGKGYLIGEDGMEYWILHYRIHQLASLWRKWCDVLLHQGAGERKFRCRAGEVYTVTT